VQPGLAPHPRGAGARAGTPAKPAGDQVDQRPAAAAGCPDEDQTGEVWGAGGPVRDQSSGGAAAGACGPSKIHVDGRGGAGVCAEPKAHGRKGEAACALDADLSGHRGVRGQPRWGLQPPESAQGQAPDPGAMQHNGCRISGDAEGGSLAEKARNALETSSASPDLAVQEAAEAHRRLRATINRQSAVMRCARLAAKHPACSPTAGLVKSITALRFTHLGGACSSCDLELLGFTVKLEEQTGEARPRRQMTPLKCCLHLDAVMVCYPAITTCVKV